MSLFYAWAFAFIDGCCVVCIFFFIAECLHFSDYYIVRSAIEIAFPSVCLSVCPSVCVSVLADRI